MHRISTKRLTALIVSLGACLALTGSPALFSAQGSSVRAGAPDNPAKNAPAARALRENKMAAAATSKPKSGKSAASKPKRTHGASQTPVSGTTTDGSGHGWPLYAKIVFTSDSTEALTVFSDPVTGQYQATLFSGINYTATVTAVEPGYGGGSASLSTEGTPLVQDFSLHADTTCQAPGYTSSEELIPVLNEHFDAGVLPEGWSIVNDSTDGGQPWLIWNDADPCGQFEGNQTGGSGPFALVNSNCDSFVTDDTSLVTPSLDLSELPNAGILWANDYEDLDSVADVDVSTDGGASWTNVWEAAGVSVPGPGYQFADMSFAAGQSNVQARFHYTGFWAWWWQVDDVALGNVPCNPIAGGLIVGNVADGNTGNGLVGATVANLTQATSTGTIDPGDPDRPSGFYAMFSPAGPQSLQASKASYTSDSESTTAFNNDVVRRDFVLQAGKVSATPSPLSAVIPPNGMSVKTLTMSNTGQPVATFSLSEINAPLLSSTTSGFASRRDVEKALARLPKDPAARAAAMVSTRGSGLPALSGLTQAPRRPLAAGDVLGSSALQEPYGWGVGFDGNSSSTWITDIGQAGGDDKAHQYDNAGNSTGQTIDLSGAISAWAADGAWNAKTGMIWYVDVVASGSSCIFEVNPATKTVTGNTICPGTGASERGLAYDVVSNTYYVGSWNDFTIYHFDADGNILDSAMVGLGISGLAYFPGTGHLFVQVSDPVDFSITVLDALNNYAVVGSFQVGGGAFDDHGGAGMEADCIGNLWMVNQNTQTLYLVASGEGATCSVDIPWLTLDPTEGTIGGTGGPGVVAGTTPVSATFNSSGMLPGLVQAQVQVSTDTPYAVPAIPVAMTVLFNDVPQGSFAWNFVYGAAGAGVMMGGPPNCGPTVYNFCPNGVVSRADMAGYLFRAIHGRNTPPPVYANTFGDVTFNDYNAFYIQGIYNDGITAGCGSGNYCPSSPNTRAQMSVFIYKGQHGDAAPPACTPDGAVFADVPCGSFAADYIYGLYNEGVTAGCGGGNFCPNANITNAQMAVFLVKGFNIPYLP
ncbi:MAG TPA: S-layer homology domain-containing protein [Thermoanaerobaculia bacterium]|nr:S-layer homology domain-containing protein [Thermoanaerobaculia bacterium]